ncbi:MAG: hypothetical protein GIW97_08280 [Candidatus Eremiobacteraeota bacterium]|nr:hypothetical protein [Candidatus Eremiobacteraeota bacterium]
MSVLKNCASLEYPKAFIKSSRARSRAVPITRSKLSTNSGVTGADLGITDRSGGAIALEHPLGSPGARLMTTLLYDFSSDYRRRRASYVYCARCSASWTLFCDEVEATRGADCHSCKTCKLGA